VLRGHDQSVSRKTVRSPLCEPPTSTLCSSYRQAAELTAPGGNKNDDFGLSVALSSDGSTALVGSPYVSGSGAAGAAYVFSRKGSTYTQTAVLTAGAANDEFGISVALSADGRTALVLDGAGVAFIFAWTASTYVQTAELTATDSAGPEGFGYSVALSADGSVALVGDSAHTVNGNAYAGVVYVFGRDGASYTQTGVLTAADVAVGAGFGVSVALSADGTTLLVGAESHTSNGNSQADAAYVFNKSGFTFTQAARFTAPAGGADFFGSSVALGADGATALVGAEFRTVDGKGATGAAYVFDRSGSSYSQTAELTASEGEAADYFGYSVALTADGSTALVGAPFHAVNGSPDAGAAYVFANLPATATSLSLSAGTNPSHYGDSLTFAATIGPSSGPTASVMFWNGIPGSSGSVDLGSATVSAGQASVTTNRLPAGSRRIYAVYDGDSNFAPSQGEIDQMVNPVPLSVSADSKMAIYGGAVPTLTFEASGFVNGDTTSSLSAQPTCSTTATEDSSDQDTSPVGTYPITCSGAEDSNYTISYTPGTLTVGPAPLDVTASSPSIVYGQPIPAISPIYAGLAPSDSAPIDPPTCDTTANEESGVGTYPTSCSGASDPNYSISYIAGSLAITPAPLTIEPKSHSVRYGHELPKLGWSANFTHGDTATDLSQQPICTTTVTTHIDGKVSSPAGMYPITCTRAVDANYAILYVSGRLKVTLAHVSMSYAGARVVKRGGKANLAAYLFVTGSGFVAGRRVVMILGSGSSAQQCITKRSNSKGHVACTITRVKQPRGKTLVTMTFPGDPKGPTYDYAPAKVSTLITVKK
jgi:MBG domain (YGX type)/Bacterial Ig-like domain (group 3)/FG-GAP repeat